MACLAGFGIRAVLIPRWGLLSVTTGPPPPFTSSSTLMTFAGVRIGSKRGRNDTQIVRKFTGQMFSDTEQTGTQTGRDYFQVIIRHIRDIRHNRVCDGNLIKQLSKEGFPYRKHCRIECPQSVVPQQFAIGDGPLWWGGGVR